MTWCGADDATGKYGVVWAVYSGCMLTTDVNQQAVILMLCRLNMRLPLMIMVVLMDNTALVRDLPRLIV